MDNCRLALVYYDCRNTFRETVFQIRKAFAYALWSQGRINEELLSVNGGAVSTVVFTGIGLEEVK